MAVDADDPAPPAPAAPAPPPGAAGESDAPGVAEAVGGAVTEGAWDGVGRLEADEVGGTVLWVEEGAFGDDEADGVRAGVVAGGVLVGVGVREGDGSPEGDRSEVGEGVIVDAGTTTAGEAGTSGGRTKR